ncbi:hypothetical protein ABIE26_000313 [Pedobacter africanus]|uniref:Uncharacterized protein n=1 Tax=Pedobacter africanus TaxID=151894 RepID=A0ACC6KVD0_9SPHI|nr:RagB/SusD family nutrient uptake outer membrane protein [Pedobacter africanus]MDR6783199.1 hypothetical protein [Pedobacter africanus]
MRNSYNIYTAALLILASVFASCKKESLNLTPTNDIIADQVYSTPEGYKQAFAKVYASWALVGTKGPGSLVGDLAGFDPAQTDFLRQYWNLQELCSDESSCAWPDPGVPDAVYGTPGPDNNMIRGLYARCIYQITLVNEFLRESTPEKLSSRNITGQAATDIALYRSEARFLRAFQYSVLMDLYGNPPFLTEADEIGKVAPKQIKRADLFNYVESELKAIEGELAAPMTNEYGRADRAAAWTILARIYLNSEVYLGAGKGKYTEAIAYASKVIGAGYSLAGNYKHLFLTDNRYTSKEIILTINYDGFKTQTYGGTTFLINGNVDPGMNPASFGIPGGGWSGYRTKSTLPLLFGDYSGNTDKRALFFGNKIANDDISVSTDGLRTTKFRNVSSTGEMGGSQDGMLCSLDFPLLRLADVYLVYAEAVLRGGTGGSMGQALAYFNQIRQRAYGNASGNLTAITLNDILNERGRELYLEGYRRTDLIRFGKFSGSDYLWPWKGGVKAGKALEDFRVLFPLPSTDVIANPNLTQNTGY